MDQRGYITESEADFYNSKIQKKDKFKEVFDFYHETVPKEEPAEKSEPVQEIVTEDSNNGVQVLDPPAKDEESKQDEA